jgi:hypothetical protein
MSIPGTDALHRREASETDVAFTQECFNGFRNLRSATSNSATSTTDIKPTIINNLPLRPVRLPIYRSNADSEDAGNIAGVHGFGGCLNLLFQQTDIAKTPLLS